MKKRSLVAALAMLMVSAIVLTSSTYAWFATSTTAKVTGINATIQNSDGTVTISANGTTFNTVLAYSDFQGISGNTLATTYTPVSFDVDNNTFIKGKIAQAEAGTDMLFKPESLTENGGEYTKITIYVKATAPGKVKASVSYATPASAPFFYSALASESVATKVYNSESRTYKPVMAAAAGNTYYDKNINDILDTSDFNTTSDSEGVLGDDVTAVVADTLDTTKLVLNFTEAGTKTVDLYVWAEGNDAACNSSVTRVDASINVDFAFEPNSAA